jgi:hypothetical protein
VSEQSEKEQSAELQTREHIQKVQFFMDRLLSLAHMRSLTHDKTKLEDPEASTFTEYTAKLAGMTYGSDEYKQCLVEMKPALDHHYQHNNHHPEHYENGVNGMDLVDLLEMIADWKAASMRHTYGDVRKSIEINSKRFGMSDQLAQILLNTVDTLEALLY